MPEDLNLEDLKAEVAKKLIIDYGFDNDEAEEVVETSVKHNPEYWTENADSSDLAGALAFDDDDE